MIGAGLLLVTSAAGCGSADDADARGGTGASTATPASSGAFCDTAREMSTLDARSDIDVTVTPEDTPEAAAAKLAAAEAEFEQAAAEAMRLLERFEGDAPVALREDIAVVRTFIGAFFEAMQAGVAGKQVDPPDLDLAEVEAAGERIRAHVKDVCGVELDTIGRDLTGSPTPGPPVSVPQPPEPVPPARPGGLDR